ncbi:Aldo/keto reductase [Mrakia frigida]|uniref:Aldo/keto reductase n=1 Tax=Mrakia frigida TaxID=29902 RepID=UPI003FCC0928
MSIALRSGYLMPLVGMGTWKVPKEDAADTIYNAIRVGYRLFDGACDYGNEKECGEGVARAIKDGLVKREDLFITSKLWNTFHAKEHVLPMVKKQLKDWGLEYFDLYLIHFPIALAYVDPSVRYPPEWAFDGKSEFKLQNTPFQETWQALEEVHKLGLARDIGFANVAGVLLCDVMRYAKVLPAILQIEHHPYLVQQPLVDLAKQFGLALTAYSSFGPASFIEIGWDKNTASLFKHPLIGGIAKAHGKTAAQVLLRWSTQQGIAVIPKSNFPNLITENLTHVDFNLTAEEIKAISGLDLGLRFNNPVAIDSRFGIFA